MKHLLSILLAAILCANASAQTIKSLGFNTTNGQVVANTGTNVLTFTNNVKFDSGNIQFVGTQIIGNGLYIDYDDGAIGGGPITLDTNASIAFQGASAATTRANLGFSTNLNTLWTATNASNARSAVGLGATWLTNTNVTNFRAAIGLGELNDPRFAALRIGDTNISFESTFEDDGINWYFNRGTNASEPAITIGYLSNSILTFLPIVFQSNSHAATTRTNLSLGLPALTNTSNVTMMRALAGSTNTNEPYSGDFYGADANSDLFKLTISNGIIIKKEGPF